MDTKLSKLSPYHKAPYIGEKRPFRSVFYPFLRNVGNCDAALIGLLQAIENHKFTPFFKQDVIDSLFQQEIMLDSCSGRALGKLRSDDFNLNHWRHLINNIGGTLGSSLSYIASADKKNDPEVLEITKENQGIMRNLKIIEDWIFYHPEARQTIQLILKNNLPKT
jgi:hypothetical protein